MVRLSSLASIMAISVFVANDAAASFDNSACKGHFPCCQGGLESVLKVLPWRHRPFLLRLLYHLADRLDKKALQDFLVVKREKR